MRRYSAIRIFNGAMEEGDVGIFIGDSICKEAFVYDRPGNLYLPAREHMISLGLGMAMCTDRRVFIFCDDSYFVRNISEAAHIATSKCENIYSVILVSGIYADVGPHPTIFNSLMAPRAMLYNMGLKVHNYARHFKNTRNPIKDIRAIWSRARGPLIATLDVDRGTKDFNDNYPDEIDSLNDIIEFISNKDIPSYNFVPPISFLEEFTEEG